MTTDHLEDDKNQMLAELAILLSKEKDLHERIEIRRTIKEIIHPEGFLRVVGVHRHICDKCGKRWVHQNDYCATKNEIDTRLSCQKCG